MRCLHRLGSVLLSCALGTIAAASNFTSGEAVAARFGVHEITLTGDSQVANPFDTRAMVTFTPPSGAGQAKTVAAFFDGDNTWRARVYVSEPGEWKWSSECATDRGLAGQKGTFKATGSALPGRLLPHPKNSRHWMTENGRWFLNLSDTAYYLLCAYDGNGSAVPDDVAQRYVRDAAAHGITSVRCSLAAGSGGFVQSREQWQRWHFAGAGLDRLHLENLQCADRRLRMMLDTHPEIAVQLILFPLEGYGGDDTFWAAMTPGERERLMRNLVARFAAYPQLFWLMVNDAHYGEKHPNNNALAREAGTYLQQHDPWQHPRSTGHARRLPFVFGGEDWATYIHIEHAHDLGAEQYGRYEAYAKPVFLGEDRYEQDRVEISPVNMRYWQRRLFWAWLLSGGSANYGGRWWEVHPYGETAKRTAHHQRKKMVFHTGLTGLDSVRVIRDYFSDRGIEISDFTAAPGLVRDADGRTGVDAPKLMRRDGDEFLAYHPNAISSGRTAEADPARAARLSLDLSGFPGRFEVVWLRPHDGVSERGAGVEGGQPIELVSPWMGHDAVVRLVRTGSQRATHAASAATAASPSGRTGSPRGWQAGFAEADITPKPGLPVMSAGFARSRIMSGTESPLRAQALVLADADGRRVVLFTADLLGFGRITVDAVRHKIGKAHGIPEENICFTASHTHAAPAVNFRTASAIGDVNVWYLGFLETTLLELADRALNNLAPAEVAYGWTEVQIGMSRRLPSEQGIRWAPNPAGSYDKHTPILRVRRERSPRQVVVVGHACHPTSIGTLDQWSAEYPGAMRSKLEADLEDCRAMFVNGAGGNAKVTYLDPATGRPEFAASLEKSRQAGAALAQGVLDRIGGGPPLESLDARLSAALVRGQLSLQKGPSQEEIRKMAFEGSITGTTTWWARKILAFPDPRREFDYAVQSWQLGDLTIVALEGEVCGDWGAMARSLPATRHSMTIGYANEVSSYIPTARIIQEGGYEGDLSHKIYLLPGRFEPRMEVELTTLIRRAVARVAGQPAPLEPVAFDRSRLLMTVDQSGAERRITFPAEWESRRRQIVAHVEQVTGPVPGPAFRVPLELQVLEEVDCGSYVRRKIAYNVDPHDRVESFLLLPKNLRGKAPAVLALHGTNRYGKELVAGMIDVLPNSDAAATRRQYYGHELAERGYIVIAPDYWYYGLYRGKHYNPPPGQLYDPHQRGYATAKMKGVWNHMRAIDVLETLPEVDRERIGSIGHSLGGYNTLFLGLFDPRVKVMVSSAGYNAFHDYAASSYGGGDLKNWGIDKELRRIRTVYQNDPDQVPFDFPELLAALAPRPVFTSAPLHDDYFDHPGVLKCLDAARPVYELFGAADHLELQSPDARHDFPDAQRQAAYEFLDRHLRGNPPAKRSTSHQGGVSPREQSASPAGPARVPPPLSADLRKLLAPGAAVEKVAGGFAFTEGPVWHPSGRLYFSDIRGNQTHTWSPAEGVVRHPGPGNRANGLAFDPQGRLVFCEHGGRRLSRLEQGGQFATVVDRYQNRRLNAPNDLAITPDGSIYFTDIRRNLPRGEQREIDFSGVYRLRPDGELQLIDREMDGPNGIAFSPDHRRLYVADTFQQQVWVFDVAADGSPLGKCLFAETKPISENPAARSHPDGLKIDVDGNVYVAVVETGVWVFDRNGRNLGVIPVPEPTTNVAFGDADGRTLYITASTGLYRIRLGKPGFEV